jgi:hypothetical protein
MNNYDSITAKIIDKIEQTIIVIAPAIIALTHIYAPTFQIAAYVDGGVTCLISILEYAKMFIKK